MSNLNTLIYNSYDKLTIDELLDIHGVDKEEWMKGKNIGLGDKSPNELIQEGKDHEVKEYLIFWLII